MSNNFTLRKAANSDYDAYYEIRAEKKNLFWTGYEKAPDYTRFKGWFESRIKDSEKDIYLLFDGTSCIGSLNIDYYPSHTFIGYSVKANQEGKGIATLLVKNAVEISHNSPEIQWVKAWINHQNIGSIRVVEKNGFKKAIVSEIRTRFGVEEEYFLYVLPTN